LVATIGVPNVERYSHEAATRDRDAHHTTNFVEVACTCGVPNLDARPGRGQGRGCMDLTCKGGWGEPYKAHERNKMKTPTRIRVGRAGGDDGLRAVGARTCARAVAGSDREL